MDQTIGKTVKEAIIEIIKDGEKSISAISRELEKSGIRLHRLALTGYLMALRDMNIIKEKEVIPSKVYSINVIEEKSIYDIIGKYLMDKQESGDLCVYILYQLFKRPILKWEIDKCGADLPEFAEKYYGEERKRVIDNLEAIGIHINKNSPAYIPQKEYKDELISILMQMIVDGYNLQKYILNKTTQAKLDVSEDNEG